MDYKKPPGGAGNAFLFGLAGIGLLALLAGGSWYLKRTTHRISAPAIISEIDRPAPVKWTPVYTGDAVLVTVDVSPRDARLMLDGEPLPSNPVRVPRASVSHKLTAVADGHEPAAEMFVADQPRTIKLRLSRRK